MSAEVRRLPAVDIAGHAATSTGNDDHPMREMTRRAAGLGSAEWDLTARRDVAEYFDSLADEWHTRTSPQRTAVVSDALTRGLDPLLDGHRHRVAVEVGSGTGAYSELVAARFDCTVAVEIAEEMLRRAPVEPAARMLADASRLPLPDAAADAVVAINAFLFPDEVLRVLRAGGCFVWVNVSGEHTPIHLTTAEVLDALGVAVTGVEADAGAGSWCALRLAV